MAFTNIDRDKSFRHTPNYPASGLNERKTLFNLGHYPDFLPHVRKVCPSGMGSI